MCCGGAVAGVEDVAGLLPGGLEEAELVRGVELGDEIVEVVQGIVEGGYKSVVGDDGAVDYTRGADAGYERGDPEVPRQVAA